MDDLAQIPWYCDDCEWQGTSGECKSDIVSGELVCPSCGGAVLTDYVKEPVADTTEYTMIVKYNTANPWKVVIVESIINLALYLLRDKE